MMTHAFSIIIGLLNVYEFIMNILRILRPQTRAGKLRLAAIVGVVGTILGVSVPKELIFPSLADEPPVLTSPQVRSTQSTSNSTPE